MVRGKSTGTIQLSIKDEWCSFFYEIVVPEIDIHPLKTLDSIGLNELEWDRLLPSIPIGLN